MEQRSAEWFAFRLGKITASALTNVMKRTKYGESKYKTRYRTELAIERLTGKRANIVIPNQAMKDGTEREPDARILFEKIAGKKVDECGAYVHPDIKNASASPDGMVVGEKAILELKCPTMVTHSHNLLSSTMPKDYVYQVQWQIECTKSDYGYFASYHPDYPDGLKLKWMRVERDEEIINDLVKTIGEFDNEIEELVTELKESNIQF
jgi:putative phage-type endonuclease|tara:strand:+ start:685 stop:1308 length:624 start_codon:yes stop_codon:yes gene_type:complete